MSSENTKKNYNEKINTFSNIIKEKYNKSLINLNMNILYKEIRNAHYKNKPYSLQWKICLCSALINYYKTNTKKNTSKLTKMIYKFQTQINYEESKQLQTEKEKQNYIDHDTLNLKAKEYEKYTTEKDMYNYLILSMLSSDQGVLRPNVYSKMRLITNNTKNIDITIDNCINLDTQIMYINNDKNITKIKSQKNKIIHKEIHLHPEFFKIILDSYNFIKRDYLFDFKIKTIRIKLLKLLQELTGLKYTFSMARSAYINNYMDKKIDANLNDKNKLAYEMNHTQNTQEKSYKKIKPTSNKIMTVKKSLTAEDNYLIYKRAITMVNWANKNIKKISYDNIQKYKISIGEDNKYICNLQIPDKSEYKYKCYLNKLINNANVNKKNISEKLMKKHNIVNENNIYKLKE